MISELKIRNFKSLESVDLKLGHFNLLVGANASGKSNFLDALRFLMEEHHLRQKDLVDVFGTPSVVSEVMHGKREMTKGQIAQLSARFHVSPELFF